MEQTELEKAGAAAVSISENIKPELTSQEQVFFVAGFQECIKWQQSQQTLCIPITELGDFVDWIRDINFKKYAEGWCEAGGSNGWHCTTTELMLMYEQHSSSK